VTSSWEFCVGGGARLPVGQIPMTSPVSAHMFTFRPVMPPG